jgi:hypothetical protein
MARAAVIEAQSTRAISSPEPRKTEALAEAHELLRAPY